MSGFTLLHPPHAFITCTGTALLFFYLFTPHK